MCPWGEEAAGWLRRLSGPFGLVLTAFLLT